MTTTFKILPMCNKPLQDRVASLGLTIERISVSGAFSKFRISSPNFEQVINTNEANAFLSGYELALKLTTQEKA